MINELVKLDNAYKQIMSVESIKNALREDPKTQEMRICPDFQYQVYMLINKKVILDVGEELYNSKGNLISSAKNLILKYQKTFLDYPKNKARIKVNQKYNKKITDKFIELETELKKLKYLDKSFKSSVEKTMIQTFKNDIDQLKHEYGKEYQQCKSTQLIPNVLKLN